MKTSAARKLYLADPEAKLRPVPLTALRAPGRVSAGGEYPAGNTTLERWRDACDG